jgi:hypothetical protein
MCRPSQPARARGFTADLFSIPYLQYKVGATQAPTQSTSQQMPSEQSTLTGGLEEQEMTLIHVIQAEMDSKVHNYKRLHF